MGYNDLTEGITSGLSDNFLKHKGLSQNQSNHIWVKSNYQQKKEIFFGRARLRYST